MQTWIWVVIIILVVSGALFPVVVVPTVIYFVLLTRFSPKKWARECTIPDDEEYLGMFNEGMEWENKYSDFKSPVSISSCGFKLEGEYFDFGNKKSVIIIAGRMESLLYSYYFAEPYRSSGYNVLVIDNRAHGLSEGHINSMGYREYKDILNWSEFLHEEKGINKIILHGICIGSQTALFALTSPKCPSYLSGMVAEGMFVSFYEMFKNQLRKRNKPLFPTQQMIAVLARIIAGADIVHDGPIFRIGKLNKPILFLYSLEDAFAKPDKARELYEACSAPKKIVWFEKGEHSRIRPNDREGYDGAVVGFLNEYITFEAVSE